MSQQFIQRLANYLANEVLIKGLANSKTFQRFAVRTEASLKDVHEAGAKTLQQTLNEAAAAGVQTTAAGGGPPRPPLRGVPGFVSSFVKEIRNDVMGTTTAPR